MTVRPSSAHAFHEKRHRGTASASACRVARAGRKETNGRTHNISFLGIESEANSRRNMLRSVDEPHAFLKIWIQRCGVDDFPSDV